jgi:hypothetical protein
MLLRRQVDSNGRKREAGREVGQFILIDGVEIDRGLVPDLDFEQSVTGGRERIGGSQGLKSAVPMERRGTLWSPNPPFRNANSAIWVSSDQNSTVIERKQRCDLTDTPGLRLSSPSIQTRITLYQLKRVHSSARSHAHINCRCSGTVWRSAALYTMPKCVRPPASRPEDTPDEASPQLLGATISIINLHLLVVR